MTFKDFRNIMRNPNRDLRRGTLMGAVLRYRLMADPVAEAEYHKVPFTPIWWWWNAEADEYVMTLWDTNLLTDEQQTFLTHHEAMHILTKAKHNLG